MAIWKQLVLVTVLTGAALVGWAVYVPAALPWLDRIGVLGVLRDAGLVADGPAAEGGGGSGGGFGGGFGGGGNGPVMVVAVPAKVVVLNDVISSIGSARGARAVTVQAEVAGQVTAVRVAPGDAVVVGQVLAELDREAAQIALDRAALILADAQATWDRVEQLRARGATTDLQVQDADLALQTARLQHREAEFEVQRHRIVAPIAGVAGLLGVEVGDRLSQGAEITRIEDRSSLIVDFRVPERIVARLQAGDPVQVAALADPDLRLQGRISALDNRVDETSRTLMVQAAIENTADRLRAGMAFSITLSFTGAAHPAVAPLAIQWGSEGSYVWVVRNGLAVQVPALIVQRNSDAVLISADLQPGDLVVTEGVQSLRPGAEVSVVQADGAAVLRPVAQRG